jgi:hypothetical protein
MNKTIAKIGPSDHGRRMSLAEFDEAEGQEGYLIVDPDERVMVVMRRVRNRWVETTVRPPDIHRTRLLPGFEFSIDAAFKNAGLS